MYLELSQTQHNVVTPCGQHNVVTPCGQQEKREITYLGIDISPHTW